MGAVASISASKEDKESFKKDLADFRAKLIEQGINPNLSKLFRSMINSEIENIDGNPFIVVQLGNESSS